MAPRRVGQREKGRNGQHCASDQCDKHIVLHGHLLEVDSAIGYRVRKNLGGGIEVVSIYQPNAPITREARDRDRQFCFDLCCRA
jgi:hypothetical protein